MKLIVFNILFANLLAIGTVKNQVFASENPKGDTVVVKLKNKNKVLIITEESKNLKSFRNVNLNQIIADIDSSFRADSIIANGGEMELGLFQKDSTLKIKVISGKEGTRKSYNAIVIIKDFENDFEDTSRKNSFNYEYSFNPNKKRKRRTRIDDIFEIDLGWNNYLENGKLPSDDNKSYGLAPVWSNVVTLRGLKNIYWNKNHTLFSTSFGLEVSWNNYKYDNDVIITKGSDAVSFEPFPADQKKIKSKLTVSWLNIPIMMHYRAKNSSFHMAVGGFAGYRLGSHSKTKYTVNGDEKKDHVYTNFYLNSLQYGARVQVGFYDVDFFAQYNFNELFSKNKGPALTPFSFGFTF